MKKDQCLTSVCLSNNRYTVLISEKDRLREKFSSESDKYYRVTLFDELGFVRKKCPSCQRYFWTLDQNRSVCPEQPCQNYEFLGNPPTARKFDYISAWRKIEDFFSKNGHQPIPRYPVVCRWRPDLYFTVASIVDFQRLESGRVVFEFPANPLIIPQICLRFLDIANVGVTGRHYTSFCMIGQHALANRQGYWKDQCVELDFRLLTEEFGIPKHEIVFKEDVWLGPGAFGNSLEYYVRGLELGNAVFTGFEGTPDNYKEYPEKVIDMGAGLERFVWVSQGTSNSYDAVFAEVLGKFKKETGIRFGDDAFLNKYFEYAGSLDIDQFRGVVEDYQSLSKRLGLESSELQKKVQMMQAVYSIVDHTRSLVFAISDGALPSNVGGGYNLRVILRRSLDFLRQLEFDLKLSDIARWHADYLYKLFPELREHVEDVKTVLEVEERKYENTKARASKIVEGLSKKKERIGTELLVQLYDSEGITPEALVKAGLHVEIPPDFYANVTERHMAQKAEGEVVPVSPNLVGLSPTTLIFYLNRDQLEFRAKVLKVIDNRYVVLESTAFYARSGGQEPDHGTINGLFVCDVIKSNNTVLHTVEDLQSGKIREGEIVEGHVDSHRRSLIMRHHTATHVVNGACRRVLGPWVWQHSAFKDEDMGRLDITHFAHLSRDQVMEIERISNETVRRNLPVKISWLPRTDAEKTYGFRLYQGGVVPIKDLRIVNIDGWDVEACGGTHCSSTGDIGLIKITKSERVQDGVERLEFVAGEAAINYVERQESVLMESALKLETPVEKLSASISNIKSNEETARRNARQLAKRLADLMAVEIPKQADIVSDDVKLCVSPLSEEGLDSEYHLALGDKLSKADPSIVYVAIFNERGKTRLLVFVGNKAQSRGLKAGSLVKEIAKSIGGSGGGDARFAQGGTQTAVSYLPDVRSIVFNQILR